MSDELPPIGGHAPPFRCSRLLDWPDKSSQCPHEATWHVIWTADIDNGLVCDDHHAELSKWTYHAVHPYRMECSMPGAVFLVEHNVCVVDEGLLGLARAAAASERETPWEADIG